MSYQSDLMDPRWQRKRLEIFQRDGFQCLRCWAVDRTIVVHHRIYHLRPWDCPDFDLETLCDACHHKEHAGSPTLFALRQMIERAHRAGLWDEVWRLAHLFDFSDGT